MYKRQLYEQAATEAKKAGYREPPFYIRPVGENEAAVLMRAKDYAGAKTAYEAALKERPNSGFGLYGLARVAELKGDEAEARLSLIHICRNCGFCGRLPRRRLLLQ